MFIEECKPKLTLTINLQKLTFSLYFWWCISDVCFSEPETGTALYHFLAALCRWKKIKAECCSLIQNKVIMGNSFLPVSLLIMSWELDLFISPFISSIVLLLLFWNLISEEIPKSASCITYNLCHEQYNFSRTFLREHVFL